MPSASCCTPPAAPASWSGTGRPLDQPTDAVRPTLQDTRRSCGSLVNNCYLQDLFAEPDIPSKDAGRALIAPVHDAAGKLGVTNVYWMPHETNNAARKLYDSVARRTGFIEYDMLA